MILLLMLKDTSSIKGHPGIKNLLQCPWIHIIIFYFENAAFFHAKLGSDVCPRVDNQTSGDTLQDLTRPLSGKITISQLSTHGYWSEFYGGEMPFDTKKFWLGKRHWNLETSSVVVEFPPPYNCPMVTGPTAS